MRGEPRQGANPWERGAPDAGARRGGAQGSPGCSRVAEGGVLFDETLRPRALEAALDPGGLSTTAHVVLARLGR